MYELTDREAAERLGVPHATVVAWLADLPIPQVAAGPDGARLGAEALEVLEAVKNMRAFDYGEQTIRRHLEAELGAPAGAEAEDPAPEPAAVDAFPAMDVADLVAALTGALEPLHRQLVEVGEARAREVAALSREAGELTAENAALRAEGERLQAELAEARAREARLEAVLAGAHARIAALEDRPPFRWWNPATWGR